MSSLRVVNEGQIRILADSLTAEFAVSNPRLLTRTTLIYISFWDRIAFHNIYHTWLFAVVYAIFVPESKVIPQVIKLFESKYAPPAEEPSTGSQAQIKKLNKSRLPPICRHPLPDVKRVECLREGDDATLMEKTLPASTNYLPSVGGPTQQETSQPPNPLDCYQAAFQCLNPHSAVATSILGQGAPFFMFESDANGVSSDRILASNIDSTRIFEKISHPGGVISHALGAPLLSQNGRRMFKTVKYETSYEFSEKVNDLFQVLNAKPTGATMGGLKRRLLGILDAVTGKDISTTVQKADQVNLIIGAEKKLAIGLFPYGMPLDGSDRAEWMGKIKADCQKMLRKDRLKTASKGQNGTYVCTPDLTEDEVETIVSAAIIIGDPSLFARMMLQEVNKGTWRMTIFANPDASGGAGVKDARQRLKRLCERLKKLSES
ncbi:MAG: hypothetical protein LBF26_02895 [Puniceicoccales bacterium]|jgi:hypothetical protein|nr:hypothetical protein [Puniceicoccales bacterium]